MSTRTATLIAIVCLCAIGAEAHAVCVNGPVTQWTPESGGNGHFYQAMCAPSTWDQAHADTIAIGRHLATITSEEENDFVFSLIEDESWWTNGGTYGPWIGGIQDEDAQEPAAGWAWVTGEPFGFTAWFTDEPSNTGTEDNLHFYDSTGGGVQSAHWNDLGGSFSLTYVTEWEHSLDVDLDGEVEELHDGVLILRHLFGFTGTALTDGAVDTLECTRCDATTIEPFLDLMSAGVVHDLTADWSDFENPNGVWSYLQGTTPLAHQSSWVPGSFPEMQPAWATAASGAGHVPAFFQAVTAADDYLAGDVVIHSRDDGSGGGQGEARLRFTAPSSGVYRVDLDVWIVRDIGRTVPWALVAEDTPLDSGSVASGDAFSRANPDGYSGSVLLAAGDVVDLSLPTPAVVAGDLVGTRLRLDAFGIDVDGDGEVRPLSDGLLIMRRLSGSTGSSLVNGAVDLANCTRCDGDAITAFLDAID